MPVSKLCVAVTQTLAYTHDAEYMHICISRIEEKGREVEFVMVKCDVGVR